MQRLCFEIGSRKGTEKKEVAEDVGQFCHVVYSPDALSYGFKHRYFVEESASSLLEIGAKHLLYREAAESFLSMRVAAKKEGVSLIVASAFRDVNKQRKIIDRKILRSIDFFEIYRVSAPAGFSEHHTGFAVDFYPTEPKFERSKAFRWLKANAS